MLDVLARPCAGAPLRLGPQVPSVSRALAACSMNSGPSSGNCATHSLTTRITVLLGAEGNSAAISSATSSSANSMDPPPAPSDCDLLRPTATYCDLQRPTWLPRPTSRSPCLQSTRCVPYPASFMPDGRRFGPVR